MKQKYFTAIILSLFFIFNCHKKVHEFSGAASSPEQAAINFLQAIADGDKEKVALYFINKNEYINIIHPNEKDYPAITAKMQPLEAWDTMSLHTRVGIAKLYSNLKGKKIKSVKIFYKKKSPVELGDLTAHLPDYIELEFADGSRDNIEQIASIIESGGKFKVNTISTG